MAVVAGAEKPAPPSRKTSKGSRSEGAGDSRGASKTGSTSDVRIAVEDGVGRVHFENNANGASASAVAPRHAPTAGSLESSAESGVNMALFLPPPRPLSHSIALSHL